MPEGLWNGLEFWNSVYAAAQGGKGATYEWIAGHEDLKAILEEVVARDWASRILHVGCGISTLPELMYDDGYSNIVNIDISDEAIELMRLRNVERPGMTWLEMDATTMTFADGSFDLVLDKSLLDPLLCAKDAQEVVAAYMGEVIRVLRSGGAFVCVSLNPPGVAMKSLRLRPEWSVTAVTAAAPYSFHLDAAQVFICRKGAGPPAGTAPNPGAESPQVTEDSGSQAPEPSEGCLWWTLW